MYYLLNFMFVTLMTIGIALVYAEVSSGFVAAFILIADVVNLIASAYATSKYSALVDRIEKLDSKKEKNDGKTD